MQVCTVKQELSTTNNKTEGCTANEARHSITRLVLNIQGTFVECVGSAPVAAQLAACVLELVRSPGVHGHPQPYVRRSALLASAQAGSANSMP